MTLYFKDVGVNNLAVHIEKILVENKPVWVNLCCL